MFLVATKLFRHIVREPSHLCEINLHSLKAQVVRLVDFIDFNSLGHVTHEFGGVEFIVGAGSLDDFGLFLNGKIFVGISGVNVFLVQIQHLVVGNDSRIGKVVYTSQSALGHGERSWKHFSQDSHRVWNVDDLFVLANFGDKVSMKEIVRHGHAHSQNQTVRVALEHGLHVSLGLTVKGSIKVGSILFGISDSRSFWVLVIIDEYASSSIHSAVNITHETQIRKIQSSNHIGPHGIRLVVFTPINVRATRDSGAIQNVGRFDSIKFLGNIFAVLNPGIGNKELNFLCLIRCARRYC